MSHMSQGLCYGMFASSSAQFKSGRYASAFILQNMGIVETHRPQTGQTVPVGELNIGWVERREESTPALSHDQVFKKGLSKRSTNFEPFGPTDTGKYCQILKTWGKTDFLPKK